MTYKVEFKHKNANILDIIKRKKHQRESESEYSGDDSTRPDFDWNSTRYSLLFYAKLAWCSKESNHLELFSVLPFALSFIFALLRFSNNKIVFWWF